MPLIDSAVLPVHPRTGLTAIGLRRNGDPIWPVLGGSEEADDSDSAETDNEGDDAEAADGADDSGDTEQDADDAKGDEADKPLGPAGEKALNAEKLKRREEAAKRRAAEKERDDAKAELEKLQRAQKRQAAKPVAKADDKASDVERADDIDPEEIQRKADEAATAKANERIIKAEVRASAAGKLTDPKDALKFLDLSKFEVDADGNVDSDEIDDAIADLLKDKPYLAVLAQSDGKRFKGSGDGGAKPNKPTRPRSLGEAVTRQLNKS